MLYKELFIDDNLGYQEFYVSIKVKTVGGVSDSLDKQYQKLIGSGDIHSAIEDYLNSKLLGKHLLDSDDCYNLGLIDKLVIEVGE